MNSDGPLVPLKTIYELEVDETLTKAYIVEIPTKLASKALNILRAVLPENPGRSSSYQFLRRFVKASHLPPGLCDGFQLQDGPTTIHLLIPPPHPLNPEELSAALRPHIQSDSLPVVRTTPIPLDPPTTAKQAALWSHKYWPCTFNPASQSLQKSPPLHSLRTIRAELSRPMYLESYLSLGEFAAAQCVQGTLGRKVAAVVVDPATEEVIAVAGDARWSEQATDLETEKNDQALAEGRPEQHGLMRAIAMVAQKEEQRRSGSEISLAKAAERQSTALAGRAMTPIEKFYANTNADALASIKNFPDMPRRQSAERPDAYLCSGLDVYLTHEPCIACSMAMIHSRFRTCVFIKKMPQTGGLCAEKDDGGLGYGLFWRKELNWRVVVFQYLQPDGVDLRGGEKIGDRVDGRVEPVFHA